MTLNKIMEEAGENQESKWRPDSTENSQDENIGPNDQKVTDDDDSSGSEVEEFKKPVVWKARLVTIEPVLFLFLFAGGVSYPAVKSLFYRKVCLSHFNVSICDNLHANSNHVEEDIVQQETSHWFLWENYCYEIPAIVMSFVYGSISDRFSRRLAIILPVVGQIITLANITLNSIFMDWSVGYLLVGIVFAGFSGGWVTLFLACFSYLGSVTTVEERTKRVLISEGIAGLSGVIPMLVSGLILDHTSYVFVFSLAMVLFLVTIIYILTYMKEPPKTEKKQEERTHSIFMGFLHLFTDAFKTVFRKREGHNRGRLLATIMIVFTTMLSMNAYYTVGYLFLKRRPLNWSQTTYGYFLAFASLLPSVFLLAVINPVKEKFHLKDTTLMFTGAIVGPLSELWLAFSTKTWMVFLVPVIGCLRSAGCVSRATVSKFVHPDELGKLYAAFGAFQCVSGMLGSTIYNLLYPATLSFWPGFSFCLGAITAIIPLCLIGWLRRNMSRERHLKGEVFHLDTDGEAKDPLLTSTDDMIDSSFAVNGDVRARRGKIDCYFPNAVLMTNRTSDESAFHTVL